MITATRSPTGETVLVAAIADGAGSAKCAEVGAQAACSLFTASVLAYLAAGGAVASMTQEAVEEWLGAIATTLEQRAYSDERALRDYACTFLAAVLGETHAAFVQVGDGAIVMDGPEGYRPVFWPQTGEFANSTFFLTDPEARKQMEFALEQSPVSELALLTDGLQPLALTYATRAAHAPFFQPLFHRLREAAEGELETLQSQLIEWLQSPRLNERTNDDKTLILATRHSVSR